MPWWRGGGIDWAAVNREARRVLARLQLDIDVTRLLSGYPVADSADGGDRARD